MPMATQSRKSWWAFHIYSASGDEVASALPPAPGEKSPRGNARLGALATASSAKVGPVPSRFDLMP